MDSPKAPDPQSHSSFPVLLVVFLGVILLAGLLVWVVHKRAAATAGAGAGAGARAAQQVVVPVVLGKVTRTNVPIYLDGLGTVQAFNTVTVKARVDGQLQKVAFVEGQDVHKGDVLATIDAAPFRTALEQAVAKKGQDEAQFTNAQIDLERETVLVNKKIDAQSLYDAAKALADQLAAAVKADQAAIDSAQVQLDYTTISSPLDGRTGIRLVDQGNIIHAADTNGLVVITQLKPVSVVFTLPEQNLGEINKQSAGRDLTVLATDRDNHFTLDQGMLAVIDNQIDTTTGTIKMKATFPNSTLSLWPGQFVNARLLLTTRTNGLVVPASVIQRGPNGAYAFVVNRNSPAQPPPEEQPTTQNAGLQFPNSDQPATNARSGGRGNSGGRREMTVKIQPVTVAQIEAGQALIDSGLEEGDLVVVDGQYRLSDGSRVSVAQPEKVASASTNKDTVQ